MTIFRSKVYAIYKDNKRFNTKKFASYEEARKYLRRLLTKKRGYDDRIGTAGFSIVAK